MLSETRRPVGIARRQFGHERLRQRPQRGGENRRTAPAGRRARVADLRKRLKHRFWHARQFGRHHVRRQDIGPSDEAGKAQCEGVDEVVSAANRRLGSEVVMTGRPRRVRQGQRPAARDARLKSVISTP